MHNIFSCILFLFFLTPLCSQELNYEIMGLQEKTINSEKLKTVETLLDINPDFPVNWISEYISVELILNNDEGSKSEKGSKLMFNSTQLELIKSAVIGDRIKVIVEYIPDNNQNNNSIHTINFSYKLAPAINAEYAQGYQELKRYLKESAIDKLTLISTDFKLAKVKFTVNEKGGIENVQVSETSQISAVDQILLDAFVKMPLWTPAQDHTGLNVKQELELVVGTEIGC